MNLIFRWLLGQMGNLFSGCYYLIQNLANIGFENTVVQSIFGLFKTIGLPLFAISLLVLLIKAMIDIGDNKQVSFAEIIKRAVFGVIIYLFAIDLMKYLYLYILELTSKVLQAISANGEFDITIWDFDIAGFSTMFTVILLFIALFYMFKSILNLLERFWLLLVSLLMLYIYLPGYVAGNDEGIIMWFKTCVGIGLTQFFQTFVISLGMSFFASGGSPVDFGITIGAIIAASRIDTLMDKWGQSAGGKAGNLAKGAVSSMFYAKQVLAK